MQRNNLLCQEWYTCIYFVELTTAGTEEPNFIQSFAQVYDLRW